MVLRYRLKEANFKKAESFLRKAYRRCTRQVCHRQNSSLLLIILFLGLFFALFSTCHFGCLAMKRVRLRENDGNGYD